MQVKWTRNALGNLDDAVKYITADKPAAATGVAQKIQDTSQMFAEQPGLGRPGRVSGTRELIIPSLPYILPYLEKDGIVYILRVLHTSIKWPQKL